MSIEAGIDVAWPQGARYNWEQWKDKIEFGMCKATEGLTIRDPDFTDNWNGMWELDRLMPRFAYHYFHAQDDPELQAEFFVSTVKADGLLPGDNLVMDIEATQQNGTNDNLPAATVAAYAVEFLHHVNGVAPEHRVLVYTNPAFALAGNCAGMGAWYLWIAHYGVPKPEVPPPWKEWTFWQHGDSPVDTDEFNGNHAGLLAFTRMPETR